MRFLRPVNAQDLFITPAKPRKAKGFYTSSKQSRISAVCSDARAYMDATPLYISHFILRDDCFWNVITQATTRGSPSLGLPFRSISLQTTSQIGLPAEAFGYCYYENEAAHEVIYLITIMRTRSYILFLLVVCILTRPTGSSKYGTTRKNTQRYYTTKRLIRDLLSNTTNCYVRLGEFRGYLLCVTEVCEAERNWRGKSS